MSEPLVFVVDDHPDFVRFATKLAASAGLKSRGYASGPAFLAEYAGQAGCLVLDFQMPGITGLEVLASLREAGHDLPVVFVTANADVPLAVEAMKLGAMEFLTKPCAASVLLSAIQAACEASTRVWARQQRIREARRLLAALTDRERAVAYLLANGDDTKAAAARLGVTPKTIEYHRTRLFSKLRVENAVQMTQLVLMGTRPEKSA